MKLLLVLALLFGNLSAATDTFLLPDEADDVLAYLKHVIGNTRDTFIVVTPSLRSRTLFKVLKRRADRNKPITLLTSGKHDDATALVQYRSVSLYRLRGLHSDHFEGHTGMTLLLADAQTGCIGTLPLSETVLRHDIGMFECTNDPAHIRQYQRYLTTLKARSEPYLQP